jgi:hypothetical protein
VDDLKNYQQILGNIFGDEATKAEKTKKFRSNNILSALNSDRKVFDYSEFKNCFIKRLERLNVLYLKDLSEILTNLQTSKWEGAYAELIALDYLNYHLKIKNNIADLPIRINKPVNSNVSLKKLFDEDKTKKNGDVDGYYKYSDIYYDVKILSSYKNNILANLYDDLRREHKNVYFQDNCNYNFDFNEIKKKRKEIIEELNLAIINNVDKFSSKTIKGLCFEIIRNICVRPLITDPFNYAEKHYKMFLQKSYVQKFLDSRPFFIICVSCPWFDTPINISDFAHLNKIFYRSVARRVFCQYKNLNVKYNDFLKEKFKETCSDNNISAFEVSKKLSGILFLEDLSTLNQNININSINVKGYFYLNPNADNPLNRLLDICIDHKSLHEIENFQHDNY